MIKLCLISFKHLLYYSCHAFSWGAHNIGSLFGSDFGSSFSSRLCSSIGHAHPCIREFWHPLTDSTFHNSGSASNSSNIAREFVSDCVLNREKLYLENISISVSTAAQTAQQVLWVSSLPEKSTLLFSHYLPPLRYSIRKNDQIFCSGEWIFIFSIKLLYQHFLSLLECFCNFWAGV